MNYEAIVIGVSAGGMNALEKILKNLSSDFLIPIIIVQHLHAHSRDLLAQYLNSVSVLPVKEADEKEIIEVSSVYLAPANYHLLVEHDRSLSLSTDAKVNYCRPSIDVLFETASIAYGKNLIGVILSGSNNDGANGMKLIQKSGGLTIVQDPDSAEVAIMPLATMKEIEVDHIIPIEKMSYFLEEINKESLIKSI